LFNADEDWDKFVDLDGSLTLALRVSAYYLDLDGGVEKAQTDLKEETVPSKEIVNLVSNLIPVAPVEESNDVVEKVSYELDDVKTSDVTICVINSFKEKIGIFCCHSPVLSGTPNFLWNY